MSLKSKRLQKYINVVRKEFLKEKKRSLSNFIKYGYRKYRLIFEMNELEYMVSRRIDEDLLKNVIERRFLDDIGKIEYSWFVFCEFKKIFKDEEVEILEIVQKLCEKQIEFEGV